MPSRTDEKRAEKRAEIVSTLAGHVLEAGLGDIGLRKLARVAGTSDRMLLYYFANKEELVAEVLREIAIGLEQSLDPFVGSDPLPPAQVLEIMWSTLKGSAFESHLRLWLDLSSRAARSDALLADIVADVRDGWIAWISSLIDAPPSRKETIAALMMAAVDGQLVLYPTELARGDAAIRELVSLLSRD